MRSWRSGRSFTTRSTLDPEQSPKYLAASGAGHLSRPINASVLVCEIHEAAVVSIAQANHGPASPEGELALVYDRQRILENLGGDETLLAEIVRMFFSEAETGMRAIQLAIDGADAEALHSAAHSLKGAVSNFAADHVTTVVAALEQCGKVADLAGAQRLCIELAAAIADLVATLRNDFGYVK